MKQKEFVVEGKSRLVVNYGLHYINGNSDAYFSVTADGYEWRRGRWAWAFGGMAHDEIKKTTSEFNDLIELHLSGEDGAPMHSVENAAFFVCQAFRVAEYTKREDIEREAEQGRKHLFSHLRSNETAERILAECAAIAAAVPSVAEAEEKGLEAWRSMSVVCEKLKNLPDTVEIAEVEQELTRHRESRARLLEAKQTAKRLRDEIKEVVKKHVEPLRPMWKAQADAAKAAHGLND